MIENTERKGGENSRINYMMSNALNLAHTVHKTDDLGCCGRRCCCDLEERESVMELKKSTCFDDDDFRPAPPSCQETQAQPRSHTTNHFQGAKSETFAPKALGAREAHSQSGQHT